MGYDSEKGFTSVGVDPSWQKLLEQLSSKGFSKQDLEQNEDFIKDYVKQAGGIDNVSLPRPWPAMQSGSIPRRLQLRRTQSPGILHKCYTMLIIS